MIRAGIGALAVACSALLATSGVGSAQTASSTTTTSTTAAPTIIESACTKLPALQARAERTSASSATALRSASEVVTERQGEMDVALREFATAVVSHLRAVDADGNTAATGSVLKTRQAAYVDTVVAWSQARTDRFEKDKKATQTQLQLSLLASIGAAACS